ncbi:hypothetical protein Aduo_002057 [Ancylostoma duodenale]
MCRTFRIAVLLNANGRPRYMTAYMTTENGDMYRGQVLPQRWRQDRWVRERPGLPLKLGTVQVVNYGQTRSVPESISDLLKNGNVVAACFCGFNNTEILRQELTDNGVYVPE